MLHETDFPQDLWQLLCRYSSTQTRDRLLGLMQRGNEAFRKDLLCFLNVNIDAWFYEDADSLDGFVKILEHPHPDILVNQIITRLKQKQVPFAKLRDPKAIAAAQAILKTIREKGAPLVKITTAPRIFMMPPSGEVPY